MSQPMKMFVFAVIGIVLFFALRALLGVVVDGDTPRHLATGFAVGFVVVSWLGIRGNRSERSSKKRV